MFESPEVSVRPPDLRWARRIRPNWFTPVMGTATVAIAAHGLRAHGPVAVPIATYAWAASGGGLLALAAGAIAGVPRGAVRSFADEPDTAPYLGAIPMAGLTVAAAPVAAGGSIVGRDLALIVGAALWIPATMSACVSAVVLPLHASRHQEIQLELSSPTWILAVVPPLTAAMTGSVFVANVPRGEPRSLFLIGLGMLALFGAAGAFSAIRRTVIRLKRSGVDAASAGPTLWLVLGPCGQSIATLVLLASHAGRAAPAFTALAAAIALFASGWLAYSLAVTVRQSVAGLPFSLAWWSFTFPVAALTIGSTMLAQRIASSTLLYYAVGLFWLLLVGWLLAVVGTLFAAFNEAQTTRWAVDGRSRGKSSRRDT